jgi:nucleoside-diphosphate-sugar epimerase
MDEVAAMGVTPIVCDYTTGEFGDVPTDIDYVIHVAADTDPETIEVGVEQNAIGTGLLFNNFPNAKGWWYTSTTGVYWDDPDPMYAYKETDRCGGSTRVTTRFHYGTSKFVGEGVARTLSVIHQVPLVIARLNWSYGKAGYGGLPGALVTMMLHGVPIDVHEDWPMMGSPIHEDDMVGTIGPFLDAATIGGNIVNWAGDEAISHVELAEYIGAQIGIEPVFKAVRTANAYPRVTDNTKRLEIYGPCKVDWKSGVRRMITERHPELTLSDAS